jgi:TolA-binding protein
VLRVRIALLGGCLTLGGVLLGAHASSVSFAQVAIADRTITDIVRLPLDDIDLLLRLDRDLDSHVSAAEIEGARGVVSAYLAKHLHITADGVALTPEVSGLTTWRDPSGFEYLEAKMTIGAGRRLHVVSIRSDYLTELYPGHSTQGEIAAGGRSERFVFKTGAAYERRVADDRWTAPVIVLGGAAILSLLWFVRRPRRPAVVAAMLLLAATVPIRADVIMTAAGLNATLKTMERLTGAAAAGTPAARAEATFQLAVQADELASLMNREVESHGMEQRELIDLALSRTKELGVAIAYNRDKKKFFYDGAAFRQYLAASPRGAHAANAEFTLLAYDFYQSEGNDVSQLLAAADAKKKFLTRYTTFKGNPELSLYLAVDYRDLFMHYRDGGDAAAAEKYRLLTRAEYQRIARQYPGTEQAQSARQLLRRFDEQTRR